MFGEAVISQLCGEIGSLVGTDGADLLQTIFANSQTSGRHGTEPSSVCRTFVWRHHGVCGVEAHSIR
jgi:hypothetical protein